MNELKNSSFFLVLDHLMEKLEHKRLAEVFRNISFQPMERFVNHSHLRIEINYVRKGSCLLQLESGDVPFREGNIMIISPNVEHGFVADKAGVTFLQLEFLPEIFDMFGKEGEVYTSIRAFSEQNPLIKISDNIFMMQVIQRIVNELEAGRPYYHSLVVMHYAELFLLIQRYLDEVYCPIGSNSFLNKAVLFMHNTIDQDLKIADLAGRVGISERYLRKLFMKNLHVSPCEYLNTIRINKAKELILNTDMSFKEISFVCGFHTPQHFSKTFKQSVGLSPGEYRKK